MTLGKLTRVEHVESWSLQTKAVASSTCCLDDGWPGGHYNVKAMTRLVPVCLDVLPACVPSFVGVDQESV